MKKRYIDVLPGIKIQMPDFKLVYTSTNKRKLIVIKTIPAK